MNQRVILALTIACISATVLTSIYLCVVAMATGYYLSFHMGVAAYGIMTLSSLYAISHCHFNHNPPQYFPSGLFNIFYENTVLYIVPLFAHIILLGMALISIGYINGMIAMAIASYQLPNNTNVLRASTPKKSTTVLSCQQPIECAACYETPKIQANKTVEFVLPDTISTEGKRVNATHSLLCLSCYSRYENKERDLTLVPVKQWTTYTATMPSPQTQVTYEKPYRLWCN